MWRACTKVTQSSITTPKDLGTLGRQIVLASSSAAGGLRIVVVGNGARSDCRSGESSRTRCRRENGRLVVVQVNRTPRARERSKRNGPT